MKTLRPLIILLVASLLAACGSVTCDSDSEKVREAKALSQQRLKKLYQDAVAVLPEDEERQALWAENAASLPAFADLKPVAIRTIRKQTHIRLKGCLDHHIDLVVISPPDKKPRIELWSGEGAQQLKEVLWAS